MDKLKLTLFENNSQTNMDELQWDYQLVVLSA